MKHYFFGSSEGVSVKHNQIAALAGGQQLSIKQSLFLFRPESAEFFVIDD